VTSLAPRLYADLIGKPFVADARGPGAFDCVGLACEILKRRGIAVPAFLSDEAELHRQLAAGGILAGASPLPHAEAGCIALFRMFDGDHHIGTMIDACRLLHTSLQTKRAVTESILGPLWNRRLLGFYLLEAA
jgi:hypothetical protein